MDKVNVLSRVRVHSKFLNQLSVLTNGNLSKYLQAITEVFGIVAEKQTNGVYDNSFQIEQNTPTSLLVNAGFAISNNDGSPRILYSGTKESMDITSLFSDVTYNLYLVPKESSYELGTLSFTTGSKIVTIANGNFSKLDPYESIVIDTSISGNNGVYEIYNVVGSDTLQLVETFAGTSESSLKWKIAGNFKGYKTAGKEDLIYSYDSYDLVVSSQNLSTGFILASFKKTGGAISSITDRRSDNLFTVKAIGKVLADSVITGVLNSITTIEEKASANRLNKIVADNIRAGYKEGVALSILESTLSITAGSVYTSNGERITIAPTGSASGDVTINLQEAVTNGNIIVGSNLLYVYYISPNGYGFQWNNAARNCVLIGKINYAPDIVPAFSVTEVKDAIKHNINSIVFQEKTINTYVEKELYYKNGILYYQQLDPVSREVILREAEIINIYRLNELLNSVLASVAKSERIRFSLYPTAEKDSWFFSNGIQSPILLGYKHKIVSWKIGVLDMATPAGSSQVYDYTTKEVAATSKVTKVIAKDVGTLGNPNATMGVYFYGSGTINTIKLVHEGNVISETNMQPDTDTIGQADINKLYQVEVVVETTEAVIPGIITLNQE